MVRVLVLLQFVFVAAAAGSQPVPDLSFGTGGLAFADIADERPSGRYTLAVDDDRPLVLGSVADAWQQGVGGIRLTEDGERDEAWGDDGRFFVRYQRRNRLRVSTALEAGGFALAGSFVPNDPHQPFARMLVLRIDSSGSFDPSFGQGGVVPLGLATFTYGVGLVQQGEALIFAAARGTDCVLGRLDAAGEVDLSFGSYGLTEAEGASCFHAAPALVGTGDELYLLSYTTVRGVSTLVVERFDGEGVRDDAFGVEGVATLLQAGRPIPQGHSRAAGGEITIPYPKGVSPRSFGTTPDGGVYIAGLATRGAHQDRFVTRLGSDGQPDASWGDEGTVWLGHTAPDGTTYRDIRAVLASDASLLLASATSGDDASIRLARLLPTGAADPASGGADGLDLAALVGSDLPLGTGGIDGLALDASGRLLISGTSKAPWAEVAPFVARVLPTGFSSQTTAVEPAASRSPHLRASPNPLGRTAAIRYEHHVSGPLTISVIDALGRRVATLHDGPAAAGTLRATWDASRVAPGAYVVVARVGDAVTTRRVSVVR